MNSTQLNDFRNDTATTCMGLFGCLQAASRKEDYDTSTEDVSTDIEHGTRPRSLDKYDAAVRRDRPLSNSSHSDAGRRLAQRMRSPARRRRRRKRRTLNAAITAQLREQVRAHRGCCTRSIWCGCYASKPLFSTIVLPVLDALEVDSELERVQLLEYYVRSTEEYELRALRIGWYLYHLRVLRTTFNIVLPAILALQNLGHLATLIMWITWGLSLAVSLATGYIDLFRMSDMYELNTRAFEYMKLEGWHYFGLTGRYAVFDNHQEALPVFFTRVASLRRRMIDQEFPPNRTNGGAQPAPSSSYSSSAPPAPSVQMTHFGVSPPQEPASAATQRPHLSKRPPSNGDAVTGAMDTMVTASSFMPRVQQQPTEDVISLSSIPNRNSASHALTKPPMLPLGSGSNTDRMRDSQMAQSEGARIPLGARRAHAVNAPSQPNSDASDDEDTKQVVKIQQMRAHSTRFLRSHTRATKNGSDDATADMS